MNDNRIIKKVSKLREKENALLYRKTRAASKKRPPFTVLIFVLCSIVIGISIGLFLKLEIIQWLEQPNKNNTVFNQYFMSPDEQRDGGILREAENYTVDILSPNGSDVRGCGIIINDTGTILTNVESQQGEGNLYVQFNTGDRILAKVDEINYEYGLVVLKTGKPRTNAAPSGNSSTLELGQRVAVWAGSGKIKGPNAYISIINTIYKEKGNDKSLIYINQDLPVNKNGAALADLDGRLMGMFFNKGGHSYFLPINKFSQYIAK